MNPNPRSHSKPVPLRTLESVGEPEAVHLQQVEEGVSHHAGYAVISVLQTTVEPADTRTENETHTHTSDSCWMPSGCGCLLVVAVAVRHGEDVAVEDTEL